jgi:chromate transporter
MAKTLIDLARVFSLLSLLSFGGGSATIAEMQRQVLLHHWATPRQFLDFYAIARTAPGPGMQLVTLLGWHAAGWLGALVASIAMFLPSSLVVYGVTSVWGRLGESRMKQAIMKGMTPIAVGLTLSTVVTLLRSADHPVIAAATAAVTALVLMATAVNPLLPLGVAGALYLALGG